MKWKLLFRIIFISLIFSKLIHFNFPILKQIYVYHYYNEQTAIVVDVTPRTSVNTSAKYMAIPLHLMPYAGVNFLYSYLNEPYTPLGALITYEYVAKNHTKKSYSNNWLTWGGSDLITIPISKDGEPKWGKPVGQKIKIFTHPKNSEISVTDKSFPNQTYFNNMAISFAVSLFLIVLLFKFTKAPNDGALRKPNGRM